MNDDLNGVEQPVRFRVKEDGHAEVEIVQSLAKWKRLALKRYGYRVGEGIYTDMNAVRPDETLDNIHSIYVDQWDWEKIISAEERNRPTLEAVVRAIYDVVCRTEFHVASQYSCIRPDSCRRRSLSSLPRNCTAAGRSSTRANAKCGSARSTARCSSWASGLNCPTGGLTTAGPRTTTTGPLRVPTAAAD